MVLKIMNPFIERLWCLPPCLLLVASITQGHSEELFFGKYRSITPYETSTDHLKTAVSISGLDYMEAIDVRPSDGKLFALGIRIEDSQPGVFSINLLTGQATAVGEPFREWRGFATWDLAFNPENDQLRIVSSSGANLAFDTKVGKVLRSFPPKNILGVGYSGGPAPVLYGLQGSSLVIVNDADGSVSPVGDIGHIPLSSMGFGFAVSGTSGKAYGYFDTPFGQIDGELYEIDLRTAQARLLRTSSIWIPSVAVAPVSAPPVNGLYRITGGGFRICCGLLGSIDSPLPDAEQQFIALSIPPGGPASMTILGEDEQTIFTLPGGGLRPDFHYSFSGGTVLPHSIEFNSPTPSPNPYAPTYSYGVNFNANQLSIEGRSTVPCVFCADYPEEFTHLNLIANLVSSAPLIENVRRDEDQVKFTFKGEPGYNYFVEFTTSIPAIEWRRLATFTSKLMGIEPEVTDTVKDAPLRFYRVRKEPCFCR